MCIKRPLSTPRCYPPISTSCTMTTIIASKSQLSPNKPKFKVKSSKLPNRKKFRKRLKPKNNNPDAKSSKNQSQKSRVPATSRLMKMNIQQLMIKAAISKITNSHPKEHQVRSDPPDQHPNPNPNHKNLFSLNPWWLCNLPSSNRTLNNIVSK